MIRWLADGAVPVNVNLVRNGGEYVAPPKPAYTAFSGQGRTLSGVNTLPPACQTWLRTPPLPPQQFVGQPYPATSA